ncbi:MAG: tetratricopeptide repeat protein [Spirochaetota bacterium]
MKKILAGTLLVGIGLLLVAYYDLSFKPESEAEKLYNEARLIKERAENEELFNQDILYSDSMPEGQSETYSRLDNRSAINDAIDLFTKIIARYPDTSYSAKALYHIADSYEKIGLFRLAYLKYSYILKEKRHSLDDQTQKEIIAKLAKLKIKKNYSEEGISQLYSLLEDSTDPQFRSRIYSEIGYSYLKVDEVSRAEQAFELSLREYSENQEAILGKARALKRLGKSSEAFEQYDYFLAHHGLFSQYTRDVKNAYLKQSYATALSHFKNGSYWSAINYFNIVLNRFPGSKYTENSCYWIGESYYKLGRYDTARNYYSKALSNGYYHKDQDSRIKMGYTYFMQKKYDLAAREFQTYIESYPKGRYISIARRWKESSARELTNQLQRQQENDEERDLDEMIRNSGDNDGETTSLRYETSNGNIRLDDVTEL